MRELSWAALAACALVSGYLCAEEPADIQIEPNGVRLIAEDKSPDKVLRAFNGEPGATISLLIAAPAGGLVHIDNKNSTISKFTDDKGNDLLTRKDPSSPAQSGFSMFRIARDGKNGAVEVNGPNVPAPGTTKLRLEGLLTVLCAKNTIEHVVKDVALKNGSKITGPNLELTVDLVGKPEVGTEPLGLILRAYRELDEVADVRFLKADGSEIKATRVSTAKMGILGNLTVEWSYNLAEKVDAATVKLLLWSDLQKKRVPFKLDVDVGL